MADQNIAALIIRLVIGSAASFFAIFFWSRTRDTAWMFVIIGVVIEYAKILFSALQYFGFISSSLLTVGGLELGQVVLDNLPAVFITVGVIIMIARSRYK